MKIFLTGDMGMMGTSLKYRLDYDWVGYDIQNDWNILDLEQLTKAMEGCEMVVHAAAIPHPNDRLGFVPFFNVNVEGTVNVLQAAEANKVKRFIMISSTAFYGINMRSYDNKGTKSKGVCEMDGMIYEDHPTQLNRSPDRFDAYDISKMMDEAACAWYGTNTDMELLALRFGPCVKDEVYTDVPETDGSWRTRSFYGWTHPESILSGVKCAIEYDGPKLNYEAFNMVDEHPIGAPGYSFWSTEKAKDVLGWTPRSRK
jgi:nucleoside-diphosphate-sugar epimerase